MSSVISEGVQQLIKSTGEYDRFIQYIADIMSALNAVDPEYYESYKGSYYENRFSAEFVTQLRMIQQERMQNGDKLYNSVFLNGEFPKGVVDYLGLLINEIKNINERKHLWDSINRVSKNHFSNIHYKKSNGDMYYIIKPDFVLHKPKVLERQEYYGEIKMFDNIKALDDLVKITHWKETLDDAYTSEEFQRNGLDPRFKMYIFVYVYNKEKRTPNGRKRDTSLKALIQRQRKRNLSVNVSKDIICISLGNGQDKIIECKTLGEILDAINIDNKNDN